MTTTIRPQNDDILDAIFLYGSQITVTGTNINATAESLEPPNPFFEIDIDFETGLFVETEPKSVWWRWLAPMDGQVVINTFGSDYDTTLTFYSGITTSRDNSGLVLQTLDPIARNDDTEDSLTGSSLQSQIRAVVEEGETYYITVDGYRSAQGNISLNLTMPPFPENDNFSRRVPLIGTTVGTTGTNIGATGESNEPNHASVNFGPTDTQSVWWTWTAPANGLVTVDTFGSNYDTTLAIYEGGALAQLSEIASNDDIALSQESEILFFAEAGQTYQIAVDGFGDAQGEITISLDMDVDVTEVGSQTADVIRGTNANDVIQSGRGTDTINGRQGDDYLLGQADDDVINGGAGNDWLDGGGGSDVLTGRRGQDVFWGGAGDDLIFGGPGNDIIYSSNGNDQINSGSGLDTLWLEGPETVVLATGKGYDTINNFQLGNHRFQVEAMDSLRFTDRSTGVHIFQDRDRLAIVSDVTANTLRDNMSSIFSEIG